MDRTKGALGLAGILLVIALAMAITGLVLEALRWLLIVAAIALVIAGAVAWVSRRVSSSDT